MKEFLKSRYFKHMMFVITIFGFIYLYTINSNPEAVTNHRIVNENLTKVEYDHVDYIDSTSPSGSRCYYEFVIDNFEENDVLAFYLVHHKADVKIDGELVYSSYSDDKSYSLGRYWVFIDLKEEDLGKKVEISTTPFYRTQMSSQVDIYVGKELTLHRQVIGKDFLNLVASSVVAFVGLFFIFFKQMMSDDYFSKNSYAFSLFLFSLGALKIINTQTFALFIDVPFYFYLSNFLSIVNAFSFMIYFNSYFSESRRKILKYSYIAFGVFLIVQITVYFFGVQNMIDVILIPNILMILNLSVMSMFLLFPEENQNYNLNLKILFMMLAIGGIADLFVHNLNLGINISFCLLAVMIFVIMLQINMHQQYNKQKEEFKLKEQEVMDSRVELMMSQIRPHFMYNTLGTIYTLCLADSKKAADVVYDFSQYLRGNFKELERKSLIPVERELKHVRHYTNIEQVRFDDIKIEFDLQCTDFVLPALTVQPLVENSIKHGLMGLEEGGNLKISTYETENDYWVSVEDDGIGFDESILYEENDVKRHLGIKNIKGRLEVMCNGTLTITSEKGKGTKAVIQLPKKDNRKKEYQDESISSRR